jgi:hypothetical protein
MTIQRTRKNKESAHYGFLYSWQPSETGVKGELGKSKTAKKFKAKTNKKADNLAQESTGLNIKKDIFRSLLVVSLVMILEIVIYLAWNNFLN